MNTGALLHIPAFPPVATKLLRLSCDDETGMAGLVHLLRSDPALSAEIIRHANSPLFAFRAEVKALDQAVTLMGLRRIRMLALAVISRTYVKAILMVEDLRAYWRSSVACALVAEKLACSQGIAEDTAYAAALLHDIGCLGLMVAYPADYPQVLQAEAEALQAGLPFDLLREERNLFGMDRYEAGEWLAEKWSLPEDLRMVAGRYDSDAAETGPDLIRIVLFAARIANSLGFGIIADPNQTAYEQLRETLPPEMAAGLPRQGSDLRTQIEREIAQLDWDTCAFEQESAAQTLLSIAEPDSEVDSPADMPGSRWPFWPALAAAAAILAVVLAYFWLTAVP